MHVQAKRKPIDPDAPIDETTITVSDFIRRANIATKRIDQERVAAERAAAAAAAERSHAAEAAAKRASKGAGGAQQDVTPAVRPVTRAAAAAAAGGSDDGAWPSTAAAPAQPQPVPPVAAQAAGGAGATVPQLIMRDGKIIVDPSSLQVQVCCALQLCRSTRVMYACAVVLFTNLPVLTS